MTAANTALDPDALEDPPPPSSVAGIVQAGWTTRGRIAFDVFTCADASRLQDCTRRKHLRYENAVAAAGDLQAEWGLYSLTSCRGPGKGPKGKGKPAGAASDSDETRRFLQMLSQSPPALFDPVSCSG